MSLHKNQAIWEAHDPVSFAPPSTDLNTLPRREADHQPSLNPHLKPEVTPKMCVLQLNDQIDFFITTYSGGTGVRGTSQAAKDIMAHYVDATGQSLSAAVYGMGIGFSWVDTHQAEHWSRSNKCWAPS